MSSNGRVLIVENGPSVREILAEHLSTHGYEVARADRGSSPMRRVGTMSASENLGRPEWGPNRTFGSYSWYIPLMISQALQQVEVVVVCESNAG